MRISDWNDWISQARRTVIFCNKPFQDKPEIDFSLQTSRRLNEQVKGKYHGAASSWHTGQGHESGQRDFQEFLFPRLLEAMPRWRTERLACPVSSWPSFFFEIMPIFQCKIMGDEGKGKKTSPSTSMQGFQGDVAWIFHAHSLISMLGFLADTIVSMMSL